MIRNTELLIPVFRRGLLVVGILLILLSLGASEVDSLLNVLKANPDSLPALIRLTGLKLKSDPAGSRVHGWKAVQIAQKAEQPDWEALAYQLIGRGHAMQGHFRSATKYGEKALTAAEKSNDRTLVISVLNDLTDYAYQREDYQKSWEMLRRVHRFTLEENRNFKADHDRFLEENAALKSLLDTLRVVAYTMPDALQRQERRLRENAALAHKSTLFMILSFVLTLILMLTLLKRSSRKKGSGRFDAPEKETVVPLLFPQDSSGSGPPQALAVVDQSFKPRLLYSEGGLQPQFGEDVVEWLYPEEPDYKKTFLRKLIMEILTENRETRLITLLKLLQNKMELDGESYCLRWWRPAGDREIPGILILHLSPEPEMN